MDRLKLINEIRKRRALWDLQCSEHKSRICVPEMWRNVAINMGFNVTVDECKRKWKNLRDAYRAEVKRIEMRIASDIMKGIYDPDYEYNSKWTYYEPMGFIKDIKRPRRNIIFEKFKSQNQNNHNINQDSDDHSNHMHYLKLDPEIKFNADENYILNDDDGDVNDLYDEQLLEEAQRLQKTEILQPLIPTVNKRKAEDNVSLNCKCSKSSYDRMHFFDDLEKEEQSSMKSSPLDISYSSNMAFIGDSDYNFLVSFLKQMKKMNELQNLQFRAKMSDLMLNIISASATRNNISVSSTLTDSYNT